MELAIWRILDANANRAREALRVMEEHARFTLDDAPLAQDAKQLRHAFADAIAFLDAHRAIVARDTTGDVGTSIAGAGEYHRATSGDVIRAAGKRATEALRVIEEYGKLIPDADVRAIEQLRYRAYSLEQRLVHTTAARERFADVHCYVLITESQCARPWRDVVSDAARGGATCFQLREKAMSDAALLERARVFCDVCREHSALSIINDRADIAVAAGADGVHVGQDDISVRAARQVVGPQRIVGVSTHNASEAESALRDQPDYIAVGPMHATTLKPEYGVAGPELLRTVRAMTALPIIAIGGIDASNVGNLAQLGADGVAICRAIAANNDPENAAREIQSAFGKCAKAREEG